MTDKEIIKAMECLEGCDLNCRDCPYSQGSFYPICQRRVAKDALNLINRQQEQLEAAANGQETLQKDLDKEIKRREVQTERLREEREQKYEQIDLICGLRNELAEKDKELIRLNKEVDRLSQYVLYNEEYINDHYWDFCSIAGCERVSNDCWKTCPYSRYSKVKSKIIKEFAERLKEALPMECRTVIEGNDMEGITDTGFQKDDTMTTIDNLVKEMVGDTE